MFRPLIRSLVFVCLFVSFSFGQTPALTQAQFTALTADIAANSDMNTQPNNSDGDVAILNLYNLTASPAFTVWRTGMKIVDGLGKPGFDWTRVDNLTVSKSRIGEYMMNAGTINPSTVGIRAGFEAWFSADPGDNACRQALYDAGSRLATRFEKLFATGAGVVPTSHGVGPGLMAVEGPVTRFTIQVARGR